MIDINEILERKFKEISDVENFLNFASSKTEFWEPGTLSHGIPGIILYLESYQKAFNTNTEQISYKYIVELSKSLSNGTFNESLFSGLSGMGFSIDLASQDGKNYQNLLKKIDAVIIENIYVKIDNLRKKGLNPIDYDVISGLSGIGRYLLNRVQYNSNVTLHLKNILKYFRDIHYSYEGWTISRENQFLEKDKEYFKKGNINLGLAHGILGPISLFALSYIQGITIENHRQTLKDMAAYIVENRFCKDLRWLYRYNFIKEKNNINYIRNGWCYGNTAIMRTLFLISIALDDSYIKGLSKDIMYQVLNDGFVNLISPTICHGLSSHLIMLKLMNLYFKDPNVDDYLEKVEEKILSHYTENDNLNFLDINEKNNSKIKKSKLGILEGELGVLITLMTHKNPSLLKGKNWTNAFLIS